MAEINPYNFVPLQEKGPARNDHFPGHHRFSKDDYTGVLVCDLKAITNIITLDQKKKSRISVTDNRGIKTNSDGSDPISIDCYAFLKNSRKEAIIQGTTVKGMIRSVYEAWTTSCMHFSATSGISSKSKTDKRPYGYKDAGSFEHKQCNDKSNLCPTCRIFGTLTDNEGIKGRLSFGDAILQGELVDGPKIYKILSNPKPHHAQTYSVDGNKSGAIRGRKFYYHQRPGLSWAHDDDNLDPGKIKWCSAITQYAAIDSVFQFPILVENISLAELQAIIAAVELFKGLGHKIGLGKPIGLGSCAIEVNTQESRVFSVQSRYAPENPIPRVQLDRFRTGNRAIPDDFPPHLKEVLRLDKPSSGEVGYPAVYPRSECIDDLGVFGGKAKIDKRPLVPEVTAEDEPSDPPPKVSPDQTAAWLKEIYADRLVFFDADGKKHVKIRRKYQGSPKKLVVGNWFILFGTNASKPA